MIIKKWYYLIVTLLSSTIYEALPIVSYTNIMLSDIMESGFMIATLLFIRRIMRVIFDIPVGRMADKYGIKIIIYLGVILKITYLLLLLPQTKLCLTLSVIFDGFSISCFRGKINVLQYNILKDNDMAHFYIKYQALYNILLYTFTFTAGIIANIIFAKYHYFALIWISIIIVFFTLLFFKILPDKKELNDKALKKNAVRKKKTISLLSIIELSPRLRILIILVGMCSLGWQLNAINQFLAIKNSPDKIFSSNIFNYGIIAMLIGSFISLILPIGKNVLTDKTLANPFLNFMANLIKKFINFYIAAVLPLQNIYYLTIIYVAINFLLFLSPFILENHYIPYLIFIYLIFFVHYENKLRQMIISESDPSSVYYITACSTSFTAAASIILSYIFHVVGQYTNYYLGYSLVFGIITAVTLPALIILKRK